jgi:hypothetical protein
MRESYPFSRQPPLAAFLVGAIALASCGTRSDPGSAWDVSHLPEDAAQVSPKTDAGAIGAWDSGGSPLPDAGPPSDGGTQDPTASLPPCTGTVAAAFTREAMQAPWSNTDRYQVPKPSSLDALEASIDSLLAGDAAGAIKSADEATYTLCGGAGAEAGLALWKPASAGTGGAVFAWRVAARPIVFEAPHPFFDVGTLAESVVLFERLRARALIASGTHRCASTKLSGCDGTTFACSTSSDEVPYRESDMAHGERTFFQTAHVALVRRYPDHLAVSVHGMSSAGVSISDGTRLPTSATSPVARLDAALRAAFPGERITSCNRFPGAPAVENRLCGGTNAQGRYLNGSSDPCKTAASASTSRFIHMEQSQAVRAEAEKVARAFDTLVP